MAISLDQGKVARSSLVGPGDVLGAEVMTKKVDDRAIALRGKRW